MGQHINFEIYLGRHSDVITGELIDAIVWYWEQTGTALSLPDVQAEADFSVCTQLTRFSVTARFLVPEQNLGFCMQEEIFLPEVTPEYERIAPYLNAMAVVLRLRFKHWLRCKIGPAVVQASDG